MRTFCKVLVVGYYVKLKIDIRSHITEKYCDIDSAEVVFSLKILTICLKKVYT